MKMKKSGKNLSKGCSQNMYFDWCIIPHTTVCKHIRRKFTTLHRLKNIVHLHHEGGNYIVDRRDRHPIN